MAIEELPPAERSIDDVLAGLIRFTLGGQPFAMAVLPMGAHDRWQDGLDASMQASFTAVPESGPGVVKGLTAAFRANREQLLDALIAYDRDGVLPSRDEIRELATQQDIISAIREVRAVGGDPLAVSALSALSAVNRRRRHPTNGSTPASGPSNGSHPSTAGRRRTSRETLSHELFYVYLHAAEGRLAAVRPRLGSARPSSPSASATSSRATRRRSVSGSAGGRRAASDRSASPARRWSAP